MSSQFLLLAFFLVLVYCLVLTFDCIILISVTGVFFSIGALPGFDDLISISVTTGFFEKLKKECIIEM